MGEEEVYCIVNLEKYASMVRREAADSFAKDEKLDENEDLEGYVTINQVCQMIAENAMGKDEEGHYIITREGYNFLFAQIKTRIYNSGLSKLAAKDLLECAWDEKKKTMIFWSNEKGVVD
jgi:hypothetical protein